MIKSKQFKTRTQFLDKENPKIDGYFLQAIDCGFSGVKGFSENRVYVFPSYARKVEEEVLFEKSSPTNIQYRDIDGNFWDVGELANSNISDFGESEDLIYGKNRYFSDMFKVITETGLAIGIGDPRNIQGKTLAVQTGLPPKFLRADEEIMKSCLSGNHHFFLKIGTGQWVEYNFTIDFDNIYVMSQPMGSLFSAAVGANGRFVDYANKLLSSKVLIFDAGFKTFDIFPIRGGKPGKSQTFDNLGMEEIFTRTCNEIFDKYGVDIPIYAFQNYLENGTVNYVVDRMTAKTETANFEDILNQCSKEVCSEMLRKTSQIYNFFLNEDYICVTGGTGAAWFEYIKDSLSETKNVEIISANKNDTLAHIYSNVRGYYMFLYRKLKKDLK